MNYIDEIFIRLDIQNIREFLLHGVECVETTDKSYKERIDDSRKTAIAMIQAKFPDEDESIKLTDEVYGYVGACEEVYMEIGMQCGAALAVQLLGKRQSK